MVVHIFGGIVNFGDSMADSASETVRKLIRESEVSLYRIAKDSGLTWNTVKRFAEGENVRTDHFDKLCAYFNLELVERKPRRK